MRDGLKSAGSKAQLTLVKTPSEEFDEVVLALEQYLSPHPKPGAIACANDEMGIAAMQALESRGLKIPGDVTVTGFNGFEYRRYAKPLLTSIKSSAREMGIAAAEMLIERVENGAFKTNEILLPISLLLSDST